MFSSTAAVYGNPEVLPVVETAALRPENPYGESKLMVEQMLPWYDQAFGLKWVALRYFNAAGAVLDGRIGEDPRYASNLIPLVMKAATGRAPTIKVFGTDYPTPDGTCIRDYIHVLDLADAHLEALDFLAAGHSDIFNLGTGKGACVKEVLAAATQAAGQAHPHRVRRPPPRRPGLGLRRQRQGPHPAEVDPALRPSGDRRQRLEVAQHASGRVPNQLRSRISAAG